MVASLVPICNRGNVAELVCDYDGAKTRAANFCVVPMLIFDLLQILKSDLSPDRTKIHLAGGESIVNPLDAWLQGDFDEWQKWQNKRNFQRDFVVALIELPQPDHWLFAGVFRSYGCESRSTKDRPGFPLIKTQHYYDLVRDPSCDELAGRLIAKYSRSSRQSYPYAERLSERITLVEIRAEPMSIGKFPGFRAVDLSRADLELIVKRSVESWLTALSNVAGIYLISDTVSGKFYVGAAYGEGGIWQRWASYVESGHGGNQDLKTLLAEHGPERLKLLRYSILEIADIHASDESIYQRETHWKKILMTREFGLNLN